ncbi:hydroxymethylglutaryl-CoA lyase [Dinghuibacter silviterrae]|uniref:Hydroxymethylglutaryl-CoA lyase n=1 Tax=Dinghuibacter silviterrae TaxID=1539049 RepID=A0A4R8DYC6_9BACT|nr:hydroxymethylglutaryl-CoA lyase [Dinghuibacter silviterrae]TDX02221.1 hydroxymethylglutaryl-CoA lyase [Dinghuibacter silviterrae]
MHTKDSTAPALKNNRFVKVIECPRDAMQGWKHQIPTAVKVDYINALLRVGFDTLDFGSFVSPKAIPQMADTEAVLAGLHRPIHDTRLLAIIANRRGAEEACSHPEVGYLGYPFSVSETFQLQNTGATIAESLERVFDIHYLAKQSDKQLVVYLSMAFGNPYGDAYSKDIVYHWAQKLAHMGITSISLADTVGLASPSDIFHLTKHVVDALPEMEIGVHLHSRPGEVSEKVAAALDAGSRRIDGAIGGFGGCPMAQDELVGNLDTSDIVSYLHAHGYETHINGEALDEARAFAGTIFV